MNLSEEVDLEDYVSRPDKISAAEVRPSTFMISSLLVYLAFAYLFKSIGFARRFLLSARKLVCMQYGRIGTLYCPRISKKAIGPM